MAEPTSPPIRVVTAPNTEFEVELPGTPASGYVWRLAQCPKEIEEMGEAFRPKGPETVVGGGGHQVFRLRASSKGRFDLAFESKRAWEKEPADSRRVEIQVQ